MSEEEIIKKNKQEIIRKSNEISDLVLSFQLSEGCSYALYYFDYFIYGGTNTIVFSVYQNLPWGEIRRIESDYLESVFKGSFKKVINNCETIISSLTRMKDVFKEYDELNKKHLQSNLKK